MKSTDGGETFDKTMIWNHPYPLWVPYTVTDTFYCADGAHDLIIDETGMVHVVFGINRSIADGTNASWFPFVDGIGYWNETMPAFSNDLHALDPYGHPNSELVEDYNLIGWTQDVDGDGQITYVGTGIESIGSYYLGLSSMPQLEMDQWGGLVLFFTTPTETYDNGSQNYRHIWTRYSPDLGTTWEDEFVDLNTDLIHIFDECVYPSTASVNDNYFYLVYQFDGEPGLALWGDEDPPTENHASFMKIHRHEITNVAEQNVFMHEFDVHQNYPNPAYGNTTIPVNLRKPGELKLEIFDLTGRLVEQQVHFAKPGLNKFNIETESWQSGLYFYTVSAGDNSYSRKMIVE